MTRNSLFKLFSIAAVLMLLVAACGDDDDDSAEPTNTSPSAGGAPTETREATSGEENGGGGGDDLVAMGESLYSEQGCNACHSVDGSAGVGPTWQGLLGHEVTLESGETVTADEAYITESIKEPNAKVVEGFQPIMPAFANLTDEQINAIIAYIGSLS
ncbi:MAG: cytochrome c [Thermomicrobiales bacterium]